MTTLLRQAPLPNQATRFEASETLDPQNWDEIRAQGHRMLDDMIDHIATVRARPVWQPIPDDVRARFREKLPRAPSELGDVYREFSDFIAPYATGNVHPGFMGWVHGGGSAVGMLAEMLAAAGLKHPNELGPHHLFRRVSETEIKLVSQIHRFLKPGILLSGDGVGEFKGDRAGEFYGSCWAMAQAASFDAIRADPSKQVIMV